MGKAIRRHQTTAAIAKLTDIAELAESFANLGHELVSAFETMDWAEDEIAQAIRRHPDAADRIWHSFSLLTPRNGMGIEFVYRGHARELLERIAADQDTRPGTAAEICLACSKASLVAPFHDAAAGLYFRMWLQAYPNRPAYDEQRADQRHYEALHKHEIDDLEALMRRKLADPERRLGAIDCRGVHHGEKVACRYAQPVLDAEEVPVLVIEAAPEPDPAAGGQLALDWAAA